MNQDKDLVIGAITNYEWDDIKYYVNSLDKCGYTGKKAMILYNVKKEVADRLVDLDYTIFAWEKDEQGNFLYRVPGFNICVERFAHYWFFINKIESPIRNVIATDVKDVVFQTNPSEYLDSILKGKFGWAKKILASGENMLYKDEPWSSNNIKKAFGDYQYEVLKDTEINCAGVLAGERTYFTDLCLQIFLTCRGSKPFTPGGGGPDQAALNMTLNMKAWKDITYFSNATETWACQAGTTAAAAMAGSGDLGAAFLAGDKSLIHKFCHDLGGMLNADATKIITPSLENYAIVHQWNRIPEWKKMVEKQYAV